MEKHYKFHMTLSSTTPYSPHQQLSHLYFPRNSDLTLSQNLICFPCSSFTLLYIYYRQQVSIKKNTKVTVLFYIFTFSFNQPSSIETQLTNIPTTPTTPASIKTNEDLIFKAFKYLLNKSNPMLPFYHHLIYFVVHNRKDIGNLAAK